MQKSILLFIAALSLLYSGEHNDTNTTVESNTTENNKTISQKANDLIDDLSNGTKDLVSKVKDSTTPLVEETKNGAAKLVDAIKEKTQELLDDNASKPIDELYTKCAGCHGTDGKTKALNKSPIIAGSDFNTTLTKLQNYQEGNLDTTGMGRLMTAQVDGLSHEELKALAEYISRMEK